MTQTLLLLRGQTTLVDDSDYPALAQFRWRLNSAGYVVRTEQRYGRPFVICLHRELLSAQRGQVVDYRLTSGILMLFNEVICEVLQLWG